MALTVVRAGPTVWCSSTAASVILRRVSCTRSALRFISYFRGMREIITQKCASNLDSQYVLCHSSLHNSVQRKENDTMSATALSQSYAKLPARDVERARAFYADKLNLSPFGDRKSVVSGKSVDLGGRRIIKKKKDQRYCDRLTT